MARFESCTFWNDPSIWCYGCSLEVDLSHLECSNKKCMCSRRVNSSGHYHRENEQVLIILKASAPKSELHRRETRQTPSLIHPGFFGEVQNGS